MSYNGKKGRKVRKGRPAAPCAVRNGGKRSVICAHQAAGAGAHVALDTVRQPGMGLAGIPLAWRQRNKQALVDELRGLADEQGSRRRLAQRHMVDRGIAGEGYGAGHEKSFLVGMTATGRCRTGATWQL
ncbi:hypothetical protein Bpro_3232 [Polaromonas sp. JS666]|nr:hypothetical protein Bpro_3232 [Polaromonas sp. JS666]